MSTWFFAMYTNTDCYGKWHNTHIRFKLARSQLSAQKRVAKVLEMTTFVWGTTRLDPHESRLLTDAKSDLVLDVCMSSRVFHAGKVLDFSLLARYVVYLVTFLNLACFVCDCNLYFNILLAESDSVDLVFQILKTQL